MANRFFVMHFDLSTTKKLPLRITLTNLVKKPKDLPRDLRLHETFELRQPELLPWVYVPIGCRNSECNQISCSSTDSSTPEPLEDGDASGGVSGTPLLSGNAAEEKTALADSSNGDKGTLTSPGFSGEFATDRRKAASDLFGVRAVLQEAALAATVSNEPHQPSIRIWKLPAQGSESEDVRCTALVGSDRLGRQQLQVWELHGLLTTGRANLLARQVSDFQIEALRISPLEELRLVSCGKENIRFWRIKNAHLPGCNVSLDGLGRGNTFTDIAFCLPYQQTRSSTGADPATMAKIYVSSTCGNLLEIDYFTRAVKRVFPLHQGPIWAVAAGVRFCVTASADKAVKVWPLNFVSAYLSAEHGEACVSIDISSDGQQVLCTCGDSSVELLDLANQQHLPVSRAHPARVIHASISASMRELYTVCEDGLVRVWTLPDLQQTFEMQSPQDPPLRVAAHPAQRVLALGFKSGAVRVLAVEGPAVWMEANHHKHPVTGIWFVDLPPSAADAMTLCSHQQQPLQHRSAPSPGGNTACSHTPSMCYLVVSLDASGCICVFSQLHEFALIRVLEEPSSEPAPDGISALAFAADGSRAARYLSARKLGIIRLPQFTFEEELNPLSTACRSVVITAFSFSAAADALCVSGSDSIMRLFKMIQEDNSPCLRLSREVALLSGPISTAWISSAEGNNSIFPQVALTCGADNLLKVWNMASMRGAERRTATPQVGDSRVEPQEAMMENSVVEGEQAGASARVSQGATASPVAASSLKPEFPEFQSFAGHHEPAFMLQLLGDYVLSISPTETIMWKVNSPLLSAAADVAPLSSNNASPSNQQKTACSKLITTECTLHCRQRHTQQQLQQAQSSQSELPQGSPKQNIKQQSLRCETQSPEYLDEDSLDSPRTLSPPKRAPLPSIAAMYAANSSLPVSAVGADAGNDNIHDKGFVRSPETAEQTDPEATVLLVPPVPATSEASPKAAVTHSSAAHGMTAAVDAVSQRPASADANYSSRSFSPGRKVSGCKSDFKTRALADTPTAQIFPKTEECSALIESNKEQEQTTLAIVNHHGGREPQLHCLLRGAAARHVIGTSVTECRSSCFWRPSNGVLAHAVGNWVIVEKLASRSTSQEGRCLGLLPALLDPKRLTILQPEEAATTTSMRRASSTQSLHRGLQQQQLQLLHQSAMLAHKPPAAVLSHSLVGRPIAFSLDTTARLAATISGGLDEGRLDVWRVSDFLSAPKCMSLKTAEFPSPLDTSTFKADANSCVCEGCCMRGPERGRTFEHLSRGPTPAVGADVEDMRPQRLQLQFQFAEQPRRLVSDQLENYTTACFTRRDKNSSRLLLIASDKGWVYGYDYDANVFLFELHVDDNPISSISCGKALYLAFTTNCVARRTTVDLQRILQMQRALGPQTIDVRLQGATPSLTLDGPIKTLQLDSEAQEASLVQLQWNRHDCIEYDLAKWSQTFTGSTKGVRVPSAFKSRSNASAAGSISESEPLLLATADDGGSLRIWSRWPVPQQVADFSLRHLCTALSFLRPTLLLGCFNDGALRLFDTTTFRVAGRLQVSVPHDPPIVTFCLQLPAGSFGVRFGSESGDPAPLATQEAVCRACFFAADKLLVARGNALFLLDCTTQQVTRQVNLSTALHLANCRAEGALSVTAVCCPREDTAVIITHFGEMLLVDAFTLRLLGVVHHGIHPHLPRPNAGSHASPISLAACAECEVALACDSSVSLVQVF
ncbi:hypothetical protein Emed_004163 [Eimeria media]